MPGHEVWAPPFAWSRDPVKRPDERRFPALVIGVLLSFRCGVGSSRWPDSSTSIGYGHVVAFQSSPSTLDPVVVRASIESFIDCPTGIVEHCFDSSTFTWSDELYRVHGYARGDVVPTLDLGSFHIQSQDWDAARAFRETLTTAGGPLSMYLSLLDAGGRTREVLIFGDLIPDDENPVGVWALVVNLSRSIHVDTHRITNEAVAASALSSTVIERAKGILMGRTGLNATEAFERISRRSQTTNRKSCRCVPGNHRPRPPAHPGQRSSPHSDPAGALPDTLRPQNLVTAID
ncbi:ANTAR domain-containing protein [Arthrobacter sp. TmT3-37]